MRQIRHAIKDTQRKVYTNRKPWFWTVRAIFILQSTVLFQAQSNFEEAFSGIQFFIWCWLESDSEFRYLKSSNSGLRSIRDLVQMETPSNFSFLCEVSIWLRLIFRLCQILDIVRLCRTFDVVRLSMTFKSRWSSTLKNWFCEGRIMLLF